MNFLNFSYVCYVDYLFSSVLIILRWAKKRIRHHENLYRKTNHVKIEKN